MDQGATDIIQRASIQVKEILSTHFPKNWDEETDLFEISESYISGLEETREIEPEEKKKIRRAISSVEGLKNFPFTALPKCPAAEFLPFLTSWKSMVITELPLI